MTSLARFVEHTLEHVRATPVELARLPSDGVPGSLFSGAPGVAFFLLEAERLGGDRDLVDLADAWCALGRAWASRASRDDWEGLPRGFLLGETGLAFVEALVGDRLGDTARVRAAVARIALLASNDGGVRDDIRPGEILGGAAGILCAARALEQRLVTTDADIAATLSHLRTRALSALSESVREATSPGPDDALGFAHGIAGELWALATTHDEGPRRVEASLAALLAAAETDEEALIYWGIRRTTFTPDLLGTWCVGLAGHTLLWCAVAGRTNNAAHARVAQRTAESTWVVRTRNPSLCCGLAGQAIALQRFASLTGDTVFRRRAHARLTRAVEIAEASGDFAQNLGLWQGSLGIALVSMTRLRGEHDLPCLEAPDTGR